MWQCTINVVKTRKERLLTRELSIKLCLVSISKIVKLQKLMFHPLLLPFQESCCLRVMEDTHSGGWIKSNDGDVEIMKNLISG